MISFEEFNVFSLAQAKLRVDCIELKLILQWYGVFHYAPRIFILVNENVSQNRQNLYIFL